MVSSDGAVATPNTASLGGSIKRTSNTMLSFALLLAILIAWASQGAWAQANRATITGTVTDSSGAVVADVEVLATNLGTNVPTKTTSNRDGIYVLPNLAPGQYSVAFTKEGFETL